jgi:hypothetical protein
MIWNLIILLSLYWGARAGGFCDAACVRGQFAGGAMPTWNFERDGEVVRLDPSGPLLVRPGADVDLAISTAVAGVGVIHLFEGMLRPHLESGALEPILQPWWQQFSGPFSTIRGAGICLRRSWCL